MKYKNGGEGGISLHTTPTDQLLKQKNKPSGKMQQNGLSKCNFRALQHQTKGGGKHRAFCVKKLCLFG